MFEMLSINWRNSSIVNKLTEVEKFNQEYAQYQFLNSFIMICDESAENEEGPTLCSYCR